MKFELKNKVALVTGSSDGLGLKIALRLSDEGCIVVLNGRNKEKLNKCTLLFKKKVLAVNADVTKFKECKNLVDHIEKNLGRLDILVCNVGSGKSDSNQNNLEEWHRMIDLNLMSTVNVISAADCLLERSSGSIVCISSICGQEVMQAPLNYSASKAALNAYVKGVSRKLASKKIRINAIAPGNLMFKGSSWEKKMIENPNLVKKILENEVALGRFGTPEEIANWVVFLASSLSSFATGQIYTVDGGQVRS